MSKIFIGRKEATSHPVNAGETLVDFLARMKRDGACDADLTWEELAIYNWATTADDEVKRALIELVGCPPIKTDADGRAKSDDTDAENTILDPKFGLGQGILVPRAWQKKGLELEKTHKVKIRKRLPAPAISINRLSQWFIPESEKCKIKFVTEGVRARADKVDFEVQATRYFDRNSGGELIPSTPHTYLLRKVVRDETDESERIISSDSWKGECDAAHGILEKGTEDCYINFACAPYTVQKRYYKHDNDGNAKISLDVFHPCWHRATDGSGSLVLEDKSLVVKWTVKKDNNKLKVGQLIIWNKYDEPVFRAVLSEAKLRHGEYNLLKESVSWDKTKIFRDMMPYRVQIQAHSDMDEDNGLAVAVMHTEVRDFKYDWIQFVAFNIMPGTKDDGSGKQIYLGDSDDDNDIATRCEIMKEAIGIAYEHSKIDKDTNVLKIFMAPEFYFRGAKGAYPIEKISGIVDSMRELTDRFELADWLFVFGTAIGQLAHEKVDDSGAGTGQATIHSGFAKHNARILEVDGSDRTRIRIESRLAPNMISKDVYWRIEPTNARITKCELASKSESKNEFWLTLEAASAFSAQDIYLLEPIATILDGTLGTTTSSLRVKSRVCSRIVPAAGWKIRQGTSIGTITKCKLLGSDICLLEVDVRKSWTKGGPVELIEPITTEVFNIALVQKGWPAPSHCDKGLRGAIVYKEYVSQLDFIGDMSQRLITIDHKENRRVLPTGGSRDVLGAQPNVPGASSPTWTDKEGIEHKVGSEINKSGVGGGSVFTIDDITFGLEVCLDHGQNKLHNFYEGTTATPATAASGDPKVQIHLIPSWGMSIGLGQVCCVHDGLVFNVDGQRNNSAARINDDKWSCEKWRHEDVAEDSGGDCPKDVYKTTCSAPCPALTSDSPFECPKCKAPATPQPSGPIYKAICSKPCPTNVDVLPFDCPECGTSATRQADGPVYETTCTCAAYVSESEFDCPECGTPASLQPSSPIYKTTCSKPCPTYMDNSAFDCPDCNTPATRQADGPLYKTICTTPCPVLVGAEPFDCKVCGTPATLQQPPHALLHIGTAIGLLGGAEDVPSSNNADYFQQAGNIKVYEVLAIPDPEFV